MKTSDTLQRKKMKTTRCEILSLLFIVVIIFVVSPTWAETVGSLVLSGDPEFDSDHIANAEPNQWRWLSFPGARLAENPADPGFVTHPIEQDLSLNLGGYLGSGVIRLGNVVKVCLPRRGAADANTGLSLSCTTKWFPYKLEFKAAFPGASEAEGYDFFVDAHSTLVRVLKLHSAAGKDLILSGAAFGSDGAQWDAKAKAIVVCDNRYYYALQFVSLTGRDLARKEFTWKPDMNDSGWKLRIPIGSDEPTFGISFGFASASEGRDAAISRAANAFAQPVSASLARSKAMMDVRLRKVPQPTRWGIHLVQSHGVTSDQHRRAYYAAWTFLFQNVMDVFPENHKYPYPQVGVGKPSLWDGGEHNSPGTCSWESLLGYQWLAVVQPELAWKAFEGMMSRVDGNGMLGGESLPSRKAQTAWILYKRSSDRRRLQEVYPALKRYLLWREKNLRWIWGNHDYPGERDLEFVVSWLVDVDYAIRITDELGWMEESHHWRAKLGPMRENLRHWFFSDPGKIHQYCFADVGTHSYGDRREGHPDYIVSALILKNIPPDMLERLKAYFRGVCKPNASNAGFCFTKYPDSSFTAYGLLNHNMLEARPYVEAILRDAMRIGEFSEVIVPGPKPEGVRPSLFSALNIIDFTWLLNKVRYDSGEITTFEFPDGDGLAKKKSPEQCPADR